MIKYPETAPAPEPSERVNVCSTCRDTLLARVERERDELIKRAAKLQEAVEFIKNNPNLEDTINKVGLFIYT